MWKNKLRLRHCGKVLSIVILMSFLKSPMFAEPPMEQPQNLSESGTRFYSGSEIDLLIDEISGAALAAIEQAASEAARAAMLAGLEREALLLQAKALAVREAELKQAEALRWKLEAEQQKKAVKETKKAGIKNAIKTGVICLLSGLTIGICGTLIIGGK
jgi:hypothetical protein